MEKSIYFNTKKLIRFFLIAIFIGGTLTLLQRFYDKKRHADYSEITYTDKIEGVVENKEIIHRGYIVYVDLKGGEKRYFINAQNQDYKKKDIRFCYFLQKGDSIYKKGDNDSISVFRKNTLSYFILGKNINDAY